MKSPSQALHVASVVPHQDASQFLKELEQQPVGGEATGDDSIGDDAGDATGEPAGDEAGDVTGEPAGELTGDRVPGTHELPLHLSPSQQSVSLEHPHVLGLQFTIGPFDSHVKSTPHALQAASVSPHHLASQSLNDPEQHPDPL
jgi:hypothetical protein